MQFKIDENLPLEFESLAPFYLLSEPSLIFYKNLVDYNKDLIRVVRRER